VGALPAACVDLLSKHTGPRQWQVDRTGTLEQEPPIVGVPLVFETEIHGTPRADTVAAATSGTWVADVLDPPEEGFVLVAMPATTDRRTRLAFTDPAGRVEEGQP
jgi:hypothetical protein